MEIPTTHMEQQCEQADAEHTREQRIRAAGEYGYDVLARRQQEGEQRRRDQRPQMLSAIERQRRNEPGKDLPSRIDRSRAEDHAGCEHEQHGECPAKPGRKIQAVAAQSGTPIM